MFNTNFLNTIFFTFQKAKIKINKTKQNKKQTFSGISKKGWYSFEKKKKKKKLPDFQTQGRSDVDNQTIFFF